MLGVLVEKTHRTNPYPAKVIYLNFHPPELVSRYRDPQPQVVENYSYFLIRNRTLANLAV